MKSVGATVFGADSRHSTAESAIFAMLIIRNEQIQAFSQVSLRKFELRMVDHVRQRYPAQTANRPEPELAELVRRITAKALGYKVETEDDLRRYIEYAMIYGEDMDSSADQPWIGQILRQPDWSGTKKMDRIDDGDLARTRAMRSRR